MRRLNVNRGSELRRKPWNRERETKICERCDLVGIGGLYFEYHWQLCTG